MNCAANPPAPAEYNTGGICHRLLETSYRADMITEALIISCIVCIGLSILAYLMKSLPIIFISSIGWLVCGLEIFQQTEDMLPMLLLFVFAFGQFMFIKKEAA